MTYEVLRMASGDVTAYDLLNTSSYVIADWTRQADMSASDYWIATMPERGMTAPSAKGLELGSGKFTGSYSGIIEFFMLTENMQQYINTNILNSKPNALVTLYAYDDYSRQSVVFTGELSTPHTSNSEATYSPFGHTVHTNVQYPFFGTKKTPSAWGQVDGTTVWGFPSGAAIGKVSQS